MRCPSSYVRLEAQPPRPAQRADATGQVDASLAVPVGDQGIERVDVPVAERAAGHAEVKGKAAEHAGTQGSRFTGHEVHPQLPALDRARVHRAGQLVEKFGVRRGQPGGGGQVRHQIVAERIFDDAGGLRRFVNVFVADEDIRFLQNLDTPIGAGQVVSIVPAVAGG